MYTIPSNRHYRSRRKIAIFIKENGYSMSRTKQELADIREEYTLTALDKGSIEEDPIQQFEKWMEEAVDAELPMPNAMLVGTADKQGNPSSRVMLLKGIDDGRFLFYTNYQSRKAKQLNENPSVALTFFWVQLERQVRIEGKAQKMSHRASAQYFQQRPRGSQIGALASPQSRTINSRKELEQSFQETEEKYKGEEVPCPDYWGGYEVLPHRIEFWQGRPNRLHDRLLFYQNDQQQWELVRLAP